MITLIVDADVDRSAQVLTLTLIRETVNMPQELELSVLKESDLDAIFPGARMAGYTSREMMAAALMIDAVAEAIKSLGSVPSGHLYATLMGSMSLEMYQSIIAKLQRIGMISSRNHLLTWIQS